jgi:uncharacterized protein
MADHRTGLRQIRLAILKLVPLSLTAFLYTADNVITRTLNEILAGVSEDLFPDESGHGPITIATRSPEGDTPLHVVAWQKDVEGAKVLVAAGADINSVGDMGYTPLHVAVSQNDLSLVKLLLDAGARADLSSEFGKTAREVANEKGGEIAGLFKNHAG